MHHDPEFHHDGVLQAYATFEDLMDFTEELFYRLGALDCRYQGLDISSTPLVDRAGAAVLEYGDIDAKRSHNRDLTLAYAKSIGLDLPDDMGHGRLIMEILTEE